MQLINIKHPTDQVSFREAVLRGLGRNQGLFFPAALEKIQDMDGLLQEAFVPRSIAVLSHLIGSEVSDQSLQHMVTSAFDFPLETRC